MRDKLVSIGDDASIEDEQGGAVYKVDGQGPAHADTFVPSRTPAAARSPRSRRRSSAFATRCRSSATAGTLATVNRALVGIRDRFAIDVEGGEDLKSNGNVVQHEYESSAEDDVVAKISKKWFRVRDTYGVEIAAGEDEPLLLALTVAIDELSRPDVG